MAKTKIVIGTRGSQLALWQANYVRDELLKFNKNYEVELKLIKTQGDKILDTPLFQIGDKGLFTKEIENELLENNIDIAVHSLKDLQTDLPEGLILGAVLKRHSANDVLIAKQKNIGILDLRDNAKIATGSLRRKSQLLHIRPDLLIENLRGNINTRINKFLNSDLDAIVLAKAGVERIGLSQYISSDIGFNQILPAVGQGALAIEIRNDNSIIYDIVKKLNDDNSYRATFAERIFLKTMGGGCQTPIAAYAEIIDHDISIEGMIASEDGKTLLRDKLQKNAIEYYNIGEELAKLLLKKGV